MDAGAGVLHVKGGIVVGKAYNGVQCCHQWLRLGTMQARDPGLGVVVLAVEDTCKGNEDAWSL